MLHIQNITSDSLQKRTMLLPDGSSLTFTMYFVPMQYCWFITSMIYGDFSLNGLQITNSPNMLRQWKNVLPFGLACYSLQNREPSLQEDFLSQASTLYILTSDEVQAYEDYLDE